MYILVVMNSVAELKLEMLLKRVKVIQIRQDEFCGRWFFKTLVNRSNGSLCQVLAATQVA